MVKKSVFPYLGDPRPTYQGSSILQNSYVGLKIVNNPFEV